MQPVLETRSGHLRGKHEDGVFSFHGVPYGASTHGARRWRPSVSPVSWEGERDATHGGPDATQFGPQLLFDNEDRPESEDGQLLNVWTPEIGGGGRPIMVFVHGGGFASGGGVRELYDGQFLAREGDVVAITINYRLGPLGLLASPELRDPDSGLAANWSMHDQIAALEWVRDHAEAIGGDPGRVTIFGESAGAVSVALLAASPLARGLFQRVIVQSGAPLIISLEQAHSAAHAFCKELGVSEHDVASLRDVTVETLKSGFPAWNELARRHGYALRPCVDGVFLPEPVPDLVAAGATRDLKIVVGTNRDEMGIMPVLDPTTRSLDETGLRERIAGLLDGEDAARELIERYRVQHREHGMPGSPADLYCSMATGYFVRSGSYGFLEQHVAAGGRGYSYLVEQESGTPGFGACHGVELPYCFGTLETAGGAKEFGGHGPGSAELRERMLQAWAGFAHGRGAAAFGPEFDAERRSTMVFGPDTRAVDAPLEWERRAWQGIY